MGASSYVGRIGGLALALGVGAAVVAGGGTAWADSGSDGAGMDSSSAQPATRGGGAKASSGAQTSKSASGNNSRPAGAAAVKVPKALAPALARTVIPTVSVPESSPAQAQASTPAVAPVVVTPPSDPAPAAVAVRRTATVLPATAVPVAAPAPAIASAVAAVSNVSTGGASPTAPTQVDSPLLAALMELSRRTNPAASAVASQTAAVTSSAVTNNGVTVNPLTTYFDGVLQGNLNATSATGQELVYAFVGSSNGGKLNLGNVPTTLNPLLPDGSKGGVQSFTLLPYATWISPSSPTPTPTPTGTQTFDVRVSENTKFDQFIVKIPLVGMLAEPIITLLQQTPFVGKVLAPIIGGSVLAQISTDMSALVPTGKAVAYTYKVTSFDGTEISTNFFPATATSMFPVPGNVAATVFNGPGLGAAGTTDPYGAYQTAGSTPGLPTLRGQGLPTGAGFNVVTWDPRGEYASGGILQLDNPFYEGRDVSALIDWSLANTGTAQVSGSPLIGMIGGSYGGGIQMTTVDPRIKAIVPTIAWNSLNESLYPSKVFKTAWANALAIALLSAGAKINNQIPLGILTGNLFGFLSESAQAALGSSGPTALLTKLNVPSLFVQGTVDALFPLDQAVTNAQAMLEQNPYFSGANANQVKMIWFCGGHGVCLDPVDATAQATSIFTQDMTWLNYYIKGAPVDINQIPKFQWWDQAGSHYVAATMPFDGSFGSGVVSATSTGGRVAILPYAIGGSGPNKTNCDYAAACEFPLAQTFATKAKNALNVDITVPLKDTEIVGAPTVSFTYSGWGNSKAVYGQIVDNATGRVLGNIATPIPVTLDGKSHTVTASIANIAYTAPTVNSSLTLQIVGSATEYQNTRFGSVKLSNVTVDLPKTTAGTKV